MNIEDFMVSKDKVSLEEVLISFSFKDEKYIDFINKYNYKVILDAKENENVDSNTNAYHSEKSDIIKFYINEVMENKIGISNTNDLIAELKKDNLTKDTFIQETIPLVFEKAIDYSKVGFYFLDMVQDGTIGLIKGIDYISESKISGKDWLGFWIIREMYSGIKTNTNIKKKESLLYFIYKKYETLKDKGLNKEKIAQLLNFSQEELSQIISYFKDIDKGKKIGKDEIEESVRLLLDKYSIRNIKSKLSSKEKNIIKQVYGLGQKITNIEKIKEFEKMSVEERTNKINEIINKLASCS